MRFAFALYDVRSGLGVCGVYANGELYKFDCCGGDEKENISTVFKCGGNEIGVENEVLRGQNLAFVPDYAMVMQRAFPSSRFAKAGSHLIPKGKGLVCNFRRQASEIGYTLTIEYQFPFSLT